MKYLDEIVHVVPVIAPFDTTTTVTEFFTDIVGVKEYDAIEFVISFGAITGDTLVVKVYECDSITPGTATAIAFTYRLTSAVLTDAVGAPTACASTGLTITAGDDDKVLLIDVDPAALTDGYPYVRVGIDPGASMTHLLTGAVVLLKPRYPQQTNISAVD